MSDNRLRKIENALFEMGMPPSMTGFFYSVEMVMGKMLEPKKPLKDIYMDIGKENGISHHTVTTSIRYAVEAVDTESTAFKKYVGSPMNKYPKEFFPLLAFNIRRELEDEQDNAMRKNERKA